jgi:hypothetical protein
MEVTPMHLITAYFQHAYDISDAEPVWSVESRDSDEASLRLDVDHLDASYRSDIPTTRLDIIEGCIENHRCKHLHHLHLMVLSLLDALASPSVPSPLPSTC